MASVRATKSRVKVLERGDLFFFYRPDVGEESPGGLLDVRRFHVVLRPEGGKRARPLRMLTIGRKRLPDPAGEGGNHWGFVERVFKTPADLKEALGPASYETETLGERPVPPARPAGEGVYALVRVGRSTVLAYALELPERPGEVQEAFGIGAEGRVALAIKNPEAGSPAGMGLDGDRRVRFPERLRARFGARKWVPADPPSFLDHEGAEFVLIGGRIDAEELAGLDLQPQPEDEASAEVVRDLKIAKGDAPTRPLFEGGWE